MARKELKGVAYAAHWLSPVGALMGALAALGAKLPPPPYLTGVSGHAFQLAFAGSAEGPPRTGAPTGASYRRALAHYAALGLATELLEVTPGDDAARAAAFERVRKSIDSKRPVIVFGLHLPEFGLVRGYGDGPSHFVVSGLTTEQHGAVLPLALWPAPGATTPAPVVFIERKRKFEPRRAELAALRFALAEAEAPADGDELACGLAAYGLWRDTLLTPGAAISRRGNAATVQATLAARHEAAQFLEAIAGGHAAARDALLAAAAAYRDEVLAFSRMSSMFPYPHGGDIDNPRARELGARYVETALGHERAAIEALRVAVSRMI